ncbi:type 1 fimbria pilin [Acinetobacter calcoaceticus]|uniref:Type 1 fimbria pilin n=1 Tax=Acinetobacter calcoaceticus TaxID=471 RepID=A0A4R1Y911_ACICA|nr:type 1 fimbria pilin [Acinetobacter calcoaceticus]
MKKYFSGLSILMFGALIVTDLGATKAWAVDQQVMLFGTIIAPPLCKINDDIQLSVNFGRVSIPKIDGVNYRKKLDYLVKCDYIPENHGGVFRLSFVGKPAAFGERNSALLTSIDGLAIQIYQNNQPFTFGVPVNISLNNLPVIDVVPIRSATVTLQEKPFEATATLQVDYQ